MASSTTRLINLMNFSESLKVANGQIFWSPDGKFCAIALTTCLEIRDGVMLSLIASFNCGDLIQHVYWSPDSSLVATANFKKSVIEVWQPDNSTWRCKIDEGDAGLVKLCWAPDSRHILTTAEFHLRITVWSLVNKSVSCIKYPKDANPGLEFSHDKDYLAVAERRECKDFISLIETKSWALIKNFEVGTRDLAGVRWAPNDGVLAVWDSASDYRILIYTLCGKCLASYSAYQWALGIRVVEWSPSSQFLAVGSYDMKIRLLNHITWKVIAQFDHSSSTIGKCCVVYKEVEKRLTGFPATLATVQGLPLAEDVCYEEETSRPILLASTNSTSSNKDICPKMGVHSMKFSPDGRYIASRVENMPAVVWIWAIATLQLKAILVHCNPVKDMCWRKHDTCLLMCTGGNHIYIWTPFGCITVAVPDNPCMQIRQLRCHPSGSRVAAISKDHFTVCRFNSNVVGVNRENTDNAYREHTDNA